eukprot:6488056-Pyramimonas_sp.AAC.3
MDHEQNASTSTVRNAGSSQVQTPSHRRQAHSRANSLSLSTHFLPQPLPLRVESTGINWKIVSTFSMQANPYAC